MITFKTLILTAPFDEETRSQILSQEATLDEDQKRQMIELAWNMIALEYQSKLTKDIDLELLDIREKKKEYNKEQFKTIQESLIEELASKLDSSETQDQIDEVKQELEKHTSPVQPPSDLSS